ncbi:interferon-induced transmembrane protein 1 [Tupaia chinensis]|uniref:interferon-induced transmembrane protein 1 n=1 Tax=Tupaia chinensis TaxID=246437 RepID=UPI0007042516|nr:interferon-induced transmembrane protein 1 [Tupaia chinensis]
MLKDWHEASVLGACPPAAPVMSTVTNICSETSVHDHVVWSLFNTVFMNYCCLGFIAFAYSMKSRDRKMVGDVIGAQTYDYTAKCLHIFALVIGIILTVMFIMVFTMAPLRTSSILPLHPELARGHLKTEN